MIPRVTCYWPTHKLGRADLALTFSIDNPQKFWILSWPDCWFSYIDCLVGDFEWLHLQTESPRMTIRLRIPKSSCQRHCWRANAIFTVPREDIPPAKTERQTYMHHIPWVKYSTPIRFGQRPGPSNRKVEGEEILDLGHQNVNEQGKVGNWSQKTPRAFRR